MKKLYTLAAAALVALAAQAVIPVSWKEAALRNADAQPVKVKTTVKTPLLTRSAFEPETDFEATECQYYYWGDAFENGTNVFYLFMSNAGLLKGNPTGEGQIMRIMLVTEPYEGEGIPPLPTGSFTGSNTGEAGTYYAPQSDFMDVFVDPDDPEAGELYGYIYEAGDGKVRINEADGVYSIGAAFVGTQYDDYGNDVGSADCSGVYEGEVSYVDIFGYTPLEEDMDVEIKGVSGRYQEGYYSIAMYNVALDEDGFIVGAGELINLDLFTDEVAPMNLDDLVTDFTTPCDPFVTGQVPGQFCKGIWYDVWGGYYTNIGTSVGVYDNYGQQTNVGLADEGTKIAVSREGDIFTFDINIVTAEGHKVTSKWSGELAKYISDQSKPDSLEGIQARPLPAQGGKGCITAPDHAEVFTLSGTRAPLTGLQPGFYIVRTGSRIDKVLVK